jgi:hypothetical protein
MVTRVAQLHRERGFGSRAISHVLEMEGIPLSRHLVRRVLLSLELPRPETPTTSTNPEDEL